MKKNESLNELHDPFTICVAVVLSRIFAPVNNVHVSSHVNESLRGARQQRAWARVGLPCGCLAPP